MILWILIFIASAQTAGSTLAPQESALPQCFQLEVSAKEKKDRSYKHFRSLFSKHKVTDIEILARLIYAETKAAGEACQDRAFEISHHIASVLYNRINKRNKDIPSVVFESSQFASSLHFYSESTTKNFLCPEKSPLWNQIVGWSSEIENGKYINTLSADSVNYYLYQHSQRFQPPLWTKTLPEHPTQKNLASCIRFFENRNYALKKN